MGIAALWGDWLGGLLVAGALRITITHQMTFCINSVCHVFGKQTYSERYSARDNWFTAFFTLGEGFHNFHHRFPIDYRNGVRFYDFDPTKWLIKSLHFLGLAKELKRISSERILAAKVEMDHERALHTSACSSLESPPSLDPLRPEQA
jgi:stearoyl-CoA desaturase (delta-9 desaturase)